MKQNSRNLFSHARDACYFFASFFLVAFGQPAFIPFAGLLAAIAGFALFWTVLLTIHSKTKRFWLSTLWFGAVQLVQLSWFISHPYAYIYGVYFFIALVMGLQFGLIGLFMTPERMRSVVNIFGIAALWTLLEWSRLFYLSGLSWNPVGLSLGGSLYTLQFSSLGGVLLLSFWVMLTNLLALRAWIQWKERSSHPSANQLLSLCILWIVAAATPYLFGMQQIKMHEGLQGKHLPSLSTLLVQPAFPVEEGTIHSLDQLIVHVTSEWQQLLHLLKEKQHHSLDLIVFPEYVVPLGTYNFVYPLHTVFRHFAEQFGADSLAHLPPLELPYCTTQLSPQGIQLLVNNAFWAQGIANLFHADLLIGLEDAGEGSGNETQCYSAALLFHPSNKETLLPPVPERYEKRILVPMGEYIPFEFCARLAEGYGVFSSFTPGKEAKALRSNQFLLSPSICYEETFGHLIREGRVKGADLLVNLTSDVWYPNSRLPRQHLEHARLRSVENGVPLIRACNTGITAAIDSFGRDIAVLGGETPEKVEWVPDSLYVNVPVYTYPTLYARVGDAMMLTVCFFLLVPFFFGLIKKGN